MTLVVFLADCGNMETNTNIIRNAKLWLFICPIQNGKYLLCSSTDDQITGKNVSGGLGQYLW